MPRSHALDSVVQGPPTPHTRVRAHIYIYLYYYKRRSWWLIRSPSEKKTALTYEPNGQNICRLASLLPPNLPRFPTFPTFSAQSSAPSSPRSPRRRSPPLRPCLLPSLRHRSAASSSPPRIASSLGWAPAGGVGGGEAKVSSEIVPADAEGEEVDEERWSRLLLELLTEIVRRVDASAEWWPPRRDVVSCTCVCRWWRDATVSVVRAPLECGRITFPSSLKQPGPRDAPMHCFIRRNKKNSIFHLYLSLK